MSTANRDERIDRTHQWLYKQPDPDHGPLPADLQMLPPFEHDEAARISADFTLKAATAQYNPVRKTRATAPNDAHLIIKVELINDGADYAEIILKSESPNYQDSTIPMPLLIRGTNLKTLEAFAHANIAQLATVDEVQGLLYAAIPDAINDAMCKDWYELDFQRDHLWNAVRRLAEELIAPR